MQFTQYIIDGSSDLHKDGRTGVEGVNITLLCHHIQYRFNLQRVEKDQISLGISCGLLTCYGSSIVLHTYSISMFPFPTFYMISSLGGTVGPLQQARTILTLS